MPYEVITQGGGEGLSYTFNAIAALFNGRKGFGANLVYIAGCFATALMVMTLVIKQELLPSAKWFFGSLIMTSALMMPKVDIIIQDRLTGFENRVDNVPFMLGAFAGIASQLGDKVAEKFDSLFSKVAGPVMDYRRYGVAMASQLAARATQFTVPDADQAANVRAFVQNCMVFDIAKGKYTLQELVNSKDTWEFLKVHASPIRGFPYRSKGRSKIVTCREAVSGRDFWQEYGLEAAKRYGPEWFPHHSPRKATTELLANIELSYQYLTGLSMEATSILKQNMVRNSIREGLLELNQLHDASSVITAYAVSRAEAQQKTAYALQGKMASLSLSTLKIVIEVLFYGMFPMVVALAIFPGGFVAIKKYLIALFWIQSWAPMYSILNMLVNVYGKAKSMAAVTLADGSKVLSFSTIPRLGEANEWVAAVAGYAMMSVPFLSYGIIHYGAGALSQLATHFGSQTQSSASHAAEEATTGNYHLGNTSFDNHNHSNVNAFKYDTNTSIATGKTSTQNLDGSISHRMPDGQSTYDMSPLLPKLNSQLKVSDSLVTALNESAGESLQSARQDSLAAIQNTTAAFNELNELRKSRGKDISQAESYSQQESSLKETAFGQYDDLVTRFADENRLDKSVAVEAFAQLSINARSPEVFGISANAKIGTSLSGKAVNSQVLAKAEEYSSKHGMTELLKQASQEAKEGRLSFLNTEQSHSGDVISANLSKADSQVETAQASFNEAEYYQSQANQVAQQGLSIDQDLTRQYWGYLVQNYGVEQAKTLVSDPEANMAHMQRFSQSKREQLMQTFEAKKAIDLKQQYQRDKEQIVAAQNLEGITNTNQQNVLVEQNKADLNQAVDTRLKNQVNADLEGVTLELAQHKQAVQQEKAAIIHKANDAPETSEVPHIPGERWE